MSFLDYLKEHRGEFIDHRVAPPVGALSAADELDLALDESRTMRGGSRRRGDRRRRGDANAVRFRHVRPAFSPSPYSDPLPYEEPWERALR